MAGSEWFPQIPEQSPQVVACPEDEQGGWGGVEQKQEE